MKLMIAEKTIKVIFVVKENSSPGEIMKCADEAIEDHMHNIWEDSADRAYLFTAYPEGWDANSLPYDPQSLCETEMTIKEMRKLEE